MSNAKVNTCNYALRWRPDFRYRDDKLIEVELNNFKSTEPSVTDKEAYRVSLASLRGELAQGTGKIDVGQYSIKAGEEYNPRLDFSFLNRKDLTIVELDDYIKNFRRALEEESIALTSEVETQLAKAEKMRQSMEKESVNKNNDVKD